MADAIDPRVSARGSAHALPKRFYASVTVEQREGLHAVLLDRRAVRTPGKKLLALPSPALAQIVAGEWAGQVEVIDPFSMPVTRIANSAIEGVVGEMAAVTEEIWRYAGTDVVCYRAASPQALVEAQAQAWDPVVDWAREMLGARLVLGEGVMHVRQGTQALAAIRAAILRATGTAAVAPFRLAALSVVTTLTGSALMALRMALEGWPSEAAWSAANVEEDYQARVWGQDAEAEARRAARWREMAAAGQILAVCH